MPATSAVARCGAGGRGWRRMMTAPERPLLRRHHCCSMHHPALRHSLPPASLEWRLLRVPILPVTPPTPPWEGERATTLSLQTTGQRTGSVHSMEKLCSHFLLNPKTLQSERADKRSSSFFALFLPVLAKIGHINQILEIQMYPVSQTQRELVFKNTTPLPGGFAK